MKVIDIIKSPLNEGALSKIAIRELSELAGAAIARAQKYGDALPRISDILRREGVTATSKELAVIEKEAAKRAAEITKAEKAAFDKQNSVVAKTRAEIEKIKTGFKEFADNIGMIANGLLIVGFTYNVEEAIRTYYVNVQDAFDQWSEGGPDGISEATYRAYRQQEMSVLITKLGAAVTFGITSAGWLGLLALIGKIKGLGTVTTILSGISKTAQIGILTWLSTEPGQQWLGKVAVFHLSELPIIGPIIGPIFKFLGIRDDILSYVGQGGVKILDEIKSVIATIPGASSLMDKDPVAKPDGSQGTKPVNPADDKTNTGPDGRPINQPANNTQSITITAPQDDENTVKLPSGAWVRTADNKWRSPASGDAYITKLQGGVWIKKSASTWLNTSTGDMYVSKDPTKLSNVAPVGPDGVPTRLLK